MSDAADYWIPKFYVDTDAGRIVYEKQVQLFNMAIEEDAKLNHPDAPAAILAAGSRSSGKSVAICHRVWRHLYDTPAAKFVVIAKSNKVGAVGPWDDLINIAGAEWTHSGITEYLTTDPKNDTPGPKIESKTRVPYFEIRNRFGGKSACYMFSLPHDAEVEEKLKSSRWSGIWISELSLFLDPNVFIVSMMQLRMFHLRPWQHLLLADTNPSDEGEESWIYKLWYQRRADDKDIKALEYSKSLRLIEMFLDDNIFLTQGQRDFIGSLHAANEAQYDRMVKGKWVKGYGLQGKHFAALWSPSVHIVGSTDKSAPYGDQIELLPSTHELFAGWDLGSATNHSAHILEKRIIALASGDVSLWCVIDELVSLNEAMQIDEFTEIFHGMMKGLETKYNRKFQWKHWSDDTAVNVPRTSGEGYDALEVELASNGEISLEGVSKPDGSVRSRVKILRRLLREKRIFVSARCVRTVKMFQELKQGTKKTEFVAWNEDKHPFDSLSYPILVETGEELLDESFKPRATPRPFQIIQV